HPRTGTLIAPGTENGVWTAATVAVPRLTARSKARSARLLQRVQQRLRVLLGHAQQHPRRPLRTPPPLLPVLQRPHADPEQRRKLLLRQLIPFPDRTHVRVRGLVATTRLRLS